MGRDDIVPGAACQRVDGQTQEQRGVIRRSLLLLGIL